jgi:chromosomal replication initiation ATPase DnaA
MNPPTLQENQRLLRQQFRAFMDTAKTIMRQLDSEHVESHECRLANVAAIQRTACDYYEVPLSAMSAPIRTANYALARQVAMVLSRELTKHTLADIGACFKRDHGTIGHATSSITNRLSTDKTFAKDYQLIRARCETALHNLTMPLFAQS